MRKKALLGAWATCAFMALLTPAAHAAQGDIVLYAADASRIAGAWTRTADATAAGGQKLASTDNGWAAPDYALASPAHFVEFSFNAAANTRYHLWVRLRAKGDNKLNDSVFAQFSDAVGTNGTPLYRIGTTNGLTLNLQSKNNGKLNAWGWVDGAYWLSQQSTLSFSGSGSHTLRLQTREDGVQFDQVVLSPVAYLTVSPGQSMGDSTIIAKPATTPTVAATPYSGTASAVPGTIEVEHFDHGGEGVAYHDDDNVNSGGALRTLGVDIEGASEGGFNVGWISPGEWLSYSVNVAKAGSYVLETRLAAPAAGGSFHIEFGTTNVTGAVSVPATGGWQTWQTVSKVVSLSAGAQKMKVVFDAAGAAGLANLNWIKITPVGPTPYGTAPIAVPGAIAVDHFDNGGQGIAYGDDSAGNSGGLSRATDVDLELSSLGVPDIGWIGSGEWVSYTVNVATAGNYKISAKVASPLGGGLLRATVGTTALPQLPVPNTGGWQVYQDASWTAQLAPGTQVLTLHFDVGGFNIAALLVEAPTAPAVIDPAPVPPPPPPPPPPSPVPPVSPSPSPYPSPVVPTSNGRQILVNQGADLQAAIDNAQPGDVLLLQAGATFSGNFTLPAKSGDAYVTIRTNIADPVVSGTRITPATAANFAKIKSPNTYTALRTDPYAHHYVLQLLDFPANVSGFGEVVSLGDGSDAQNSLAMVPHHLFVDRVYVHGDASGQKRGIGLNSASTTIVDSYISNIWYVGQDSQAIAGWNGPGPYTIHNNFLEAASENFLLGGADPAIQNLIPSDVIFTRNHVTKPLSWKSRGDINVKNLFELKNGQRVLVGGNVFENNWLAAQAGYALVFTGRSQDGRAPWSVVKDLEFSNNVVRNVASAINILGRDYRFESGTSSGFVFRNNLFDNVSRASNGGDGRFLLINGGVDMTFDHNTVIQDGASVVYADTNAVQGFTMTNNIVPDNAWAIMGGGTSPGNGTIATFFPNATFLRGVFAGAPAWIYPTGNFYPASLGEVGFVDQTNGNYRLATTSQFKNAGLDGKDVGADIDAVLAATSGVK